MRVLGIFACLLVAMCAAPASAGARTGQPLDINPILEQLASEQLVRVPGSVAYFDEARVRAELGPDLRVLILPYVDYDLYEDGDENTYYDDVRAPLHDWADDRDYSVLLVEGLDVRLTGVVPPVSMLDSELPADLAELRTTTSTRDVTERMLVFSQIANGTAPDTAEEVVVAHPAPVQPTAAQLDGVLAGLQDSRIYNAPGRDDLIEDGLVANADKAGLTIRVAAFPYLAPGQPVVDYASALGARFPDDVVLVLHGDWFDVVAKDQAKALSARDFGYGDASLGLLPSGRRGDSLLRGFLERYSFLLADTAYGRPQPPPQPRPSPFDVQNTVAALAPWVLVGAAVVLGGAGLTWHRRKASTAAAEERKALRAESAAAMAAIGDLGARLLTLEERGDTIDPAMAERHATARLLYDQALTSAAMVEVRAVAEDGLELVVEEPATKEKPAEQVKPAEKAKPARKKRKRRLKSGKLTRAERKAEWTERHEQRQRDWDRQHPKKKSPKKQDGQKRWLGVPRWVYVPIVLGGLLCYLVFGWPSDPPPPVSAQATSAVEGLRTTSVYEEPGGPGIVDAARSRELIGDRAIVVVLFAGAILDDPTHFTDPRAERCAEIADLVATSVVVMYAFDDDGDYDAEYCVGPEFANAANPVDPSDYTNGGVVGSVQLGTGFRATDTDKFAEVEEYVYAFDEYTTRDSPNGVPRRGVVVPPGETPTGPQAWQVGLSLAGILAGTLAVFVLLRAAGGFVGRRGERTAAVRTRSEAVNTRLNRLADTVLHPERPKDARAARAQADVAERYVLVLHAAETARTQAELEDVERELALLEDGVRA